MRRLLSILPLLLLPFVLFAQDARRIKKDPSYIWGESFSGDYSSAQKQAIDALIVKLSAAQLLRVPSGCEKAVWSTYRTDIIAASDVFSSSGAVIRYISLKDVDRIFSRRKALAENLFRKARSAVATGDSGQALTCCSWALDLLDALPGNETLRKDLEAMVGDLSGEVPSSVPGLEYVAREAEEIRVALRKGPYRAVGRGNVASDVAAVGSDGKVTGRAGNRPSAGVKASLIASSGEPSSRGTADIESRDVGVESEMVPVGALEKNASPEEVITPGDAGNSPPKGAKAAARRVPGPVGCGMPITSVSLLGHSQGGVVAGMTAARYGEDAQSLSILRSVVVPLPKGSAGRSGGIAVPGASDQMSEQVRVQDSSLTITAGVAGGSAGIHSETVSSSMVDANATSWTAVGYTHFVIAQAAWSLAMEGGIFLGMTKGRLGGYLSAKRSFASVNEAYSCTSDGRTDFGYIWASGGQKFTGGGIAGGLLYYITPSLSLYGGAGYGYSDRYWEDNTHQWALVTDKSYSGLMIDGGIVLTIKRLSLLAGASTISFKTLCPKLGLGVRF